MSETTHHATAITVSGPNAVEANIEIVSDAGKQGLQLNRTQGGVHLRQRTLSFDAPGVNRTYAGIRGWLQEHLPTDDDGATAKMLADLLLERHPECFTDS